LKAVHGNDVDLVRKVLRPPRHYPDAKSLDLAVPACVVGLETVTLLECVRRKLIKDPQQLLPAAPWQGDKQAKHFVIHCVIIDEAHRP